MAAQLLTDPADSWRNAQAFDSHAFVIALTDEPSGLKGYIAVHNLGNGTTLGGTRFKTYDSDQEALEDVLNLSRAMSYKNALADLPYGGAKAVIRVSDGANRQEVLKAYARLVERLGGLFKTGTDVGISNDDVTLMASQTNHMLGVSTVDRSGLQTSSVAALGVFHGAKAALRQLFGDSSFKGRSIAIKGIGKLGAELAHLVISEGGTVFVSDINDQHCMALNAELPNITVVDNFFIHRQVVDIYAPCALGQEFTEAVLPELQCRAIAGGANNQLASEAVGHMLHEQGILYAPDYIVNGGGLLYVADELEPGGFKAERVLERCRNIEFVLTNIFEQAKAEQLPPFMVADALARQRIGRVNHDK